MHDPRVEFGVLGQLQVTVGGTPVNPPRAPVVRALLGALLLAEQRPLPVSRLVSLVWAGEPVGRGAVQVAVSRLRRWLTELGAGEDVGTIEYRAGAYRLVVPAEAVDLCRLRLLLGRAAAAATAEAGTTVGAARTAGEAGAGAAVSVAGAGGSVGLSGSGAIEVRLRVLDEAVGLWRGPVLCDLPQLDRDDPLVHLVEGAVRAAGVELAEAAIAAGRPAASLPRLAALTAEHPLDELLHAVLIEALAAAGRPAEALREYDALRSRLAEEFGVRPGARVHQAYLAALDQDARTVERWAVPAQLPPDIADFTGRRRQIGLVTRMLLAPDARAVPAITGMGGVGKTALAVHVAHRLGDAFPDGQLYVDLHGTDDGPADPAQVLYAFTVALGVPGWAVPDQPAERTALYRSLLADHRVLVLLDNAASEQQVRQLLPGSSRSAALVTSRAPLTGLEVVGTVPLQPLESRQAAELLAGIAGTDRARAEPEAVAEIVRLCENIPLAVRIVGARLADHPHLSLARLAAALRDERRRLNELTAGDLSVRASFMLSYLRLSEPRQRLFRWLGVLRAPDVAVWVAALLLEIPVDEAEAHIEALVDSRLLSVVRIGEDDQPRYGLHDLVRLFARERAAAQDGAAGCEAAVLRALGGWLWLAERAAEDVPGPCYAPIHGTAPRSPVPGGLPADPRAWFDAEHPALVAAVTQACVAGLDEYAWDLAGCLEKYFDLRGLFGRWRLMHENAIEVCRAAGNRLGEAVLLRGLIEVTTWSASGGDEVAMVSLYDRSRRLLSMFTELGDERGMSDALVMCAWGLIARGETGLALDSAERGVRLAEATGHLGGQARAHHVIAVAYGRSQVRDAITHLNLALDLARRQGNPRFEATVIQFLGVARCEAGQTDVGQTLLTRALGMSRTLRDEYGEAFSLLYLGKLHTSRRDPEAAAVLDATISLARRNRLPHFLADALQTAGELDLRNGLVARAVDRLEESVRIWRTRGWLAFLADALGALGEARLASGDRGGARAVWTEARQIYGDLDDGQAVGVTTERLDRLDPSSTR